VASFFTAPLEAVSVEGRLAFPGSCSGASSPRANAGTNARAVMAAVQKSLEIPFTPILYGPMTKKDNDSVLEKLNGLLEFELSGVVRYLHYSFMIFGPNRIPITKWLREQANDGMDHATQAGEWITALGGHPTLKVRPTPESNKHDVKSILTEALEFEREGLSRYVDLLQVVKDKDIALEDWCRKLIGQEQDHIYEMDKMLRSSPER
jgi:bacterioferritin